MGIMKQSGIAENGSASPGGRFGGNPVDALERAHGEQMALCNELDGIADSLARKIDRMKSMHAARALWPTIRGVHSFEEAVLFPKLREQVGPRLEPTIARLKREHEADELAAEELTDELLRLAAGDKAVEKASLAEQLHKLADSLRSHIDYEREHIIEFARGRGLA